MFLPVYIVRESLKPRISVFSGLNNFKNVTSGFRLGWLTIASPDIAGRMCIGE